MASCEATLARSTLSSLLFCCARGCLSWPYFLAFLAGGPPDPAASSKYWSLPKHGIFKLPGHVGLLLFLGGLDPPCRDEPASSGLIGEGGVLLEWRNDPGHACVNDGWSLGDFCSGLALAKVPSGTSFSCPFLTC